MRRKLRKLLEQSPLPVGKDSEQVSVKKPITSGTVEEHREAMLSSARKYIYPLQHSKHRIVLISASLFVLSVVAFFAYCTLALYRFQSTSTFIYRVTQVVPFPIARTGRTFIAYENYLFELRHYMHYYQTQQELDFNSESGKAQLAEFKKRAQEKVVNDTFVKQLAKKHNVRVTDQEVDEMITILREQNRLGGSDKAFEDVLREFWNWSVDDFKRSLRQQLLAQKVVSALDSDAYKRAEAALAELNNGKDFAELAKVVSEDPSTKPSGGEFGVAIDKTNRDIPPQTVATLFKLGSGEFSGVVNVGYGIEIVKNLEQLSPDKARGAHILFVFKDISEYVNPLKEQQKVRLYLSL